MNLAFASEKETLIDSPCCLQAVKGMPLRWDSMLAGRGKAGFLSRRHFTVLQSGVLSCKSLGSYQSVSCNTRALRTRSIQRTRLLNFVACVELCRVPEQRSYRQLLV